MFFSVIIPIYNVARYIERGFGALLAQDYSDFEVILVDDGSTDSSAAICDRLAAEHGFVSVIHKRNEGSGPARNAGIQAAKGDYILFFDIDDLLVSGAFTRLHEELANNAVDVLVFGYEEVNPVLKLRNGYRFHSLDCRSNEDIRANYTEHLSGLRLNNGFVWNKAYRREFIRTNEIKFEPLRIQQDEVFNLAVYPKAQSLRAIPDILYTYFVYDNGNTRSRFIPERLDIYRRVRDAFLTLYADWNLRDRSLFEYIHQRFFNSLVTNINFNVFHPDNTASDDIRHESELLEIMRSADVRRTIDVLRHSDYVASLHTGYFRAIDAQSAASYIRVMQRDRLKNKLKNVARKILHR